MNDKPTPVMVFGQVNQIILQAIAAQRKTKFYRAFDSLTQPIHEGGGCLLPMGECTEQDEARFLLEEAANEHDKLVRERMELAEQLQAMLQLFGGYAQDVNQHAKELACVQKSQKLVNSITLPAS